MPDVEKDASLVKEMFNTISPTYDFLNRLLSFGQDVRWRKKMSRFLPEREGLIHLDLATGTGDQILSLWKHSSKIKKSIGIDPAEKMLEIAKKKLSSKNSAVTLQTGYAEKIPYDSETFDVTTISFGIRNAADPLLALQEMHRVLKKKGRALILEFSLPKSTLMKNLHLFYLRKILPKVGGFFSQSPSSYVYLNQTIETFPYGRAFASLMQKAGFASVEIHPLTWGVVTLYVGEKR